jgi:hypothetical protein
MALRGKKPVAQSKRLKLFVFGPAGVGKTTAAIQFPKPYVIDGERGTDHYGKTIEQSGGAVFQTTDMDEVVAEVRSLLTEAHDYRTLVIDPITPLYNDLLEKAEAKVGSDFGRHYGVANQKMKRLANLILALDMNVIVSAHAKTEYGDNLKVLGQTFDGWRQLDYWFDLVIQLGRSNQFDGKQTKVKSQQRFARVEKSRIEQFPDLDVFPWSYQEFAKRFGGDAMERPAAAIQLATPQQVNAIRELLAVVKLDDGQVDKWFKKANVDAWDDMPSDAIAKCIEYVRARLPNVAPAGAA